MDMKKEEFKYTISKQLKDSQSAICTLLHYTDPILHVNDSHYMNYICLSSREYGLNLYLQNTSKELDPLVMNVLFEDYEGNSRFEDIEDFVTSKRFKNYRFMEDVSLESDAIVFKVKTFKVYYNHEGYFVWDWQADKDFVMRYDLHHGKFFDLSEILHFKELLAAYRNHQDYYYLDLSLPNSKRQEIEQCVSQSNASFKTKLRLVKAFDLPQLSMVTESVMWQVINQLMGSPLDEN